jgi:hypothetical protein
MTLLGAKAQMMLGNHCVCEVGFCDRYYVSLNINKDLS